MKYEQVGVPNFDQYPCEKLKGIPHSVAHAKIGSSDCDGTDAQMDAEVPRKQRLTGTVPVPFLALDDLASTMDHALILFSHLGFAEDYVLYSCWFILLCSI